MAQEARVGWNGARVLAEMRAAADRGLDLGAEHLLGEARKQVPHEEGTLERSGRVVDAGDLSRAVVFDTPYARRQHEDMTYRHADGRKAKYLEDPMNAERDTIQALIAAEMRRAVGS